MAKLSRLKFGAFQNSFGKSDEDPIRAELFSVERLEQFAAVLAAEQKEVAQPKIFRKLLPRLEDNGKVLVSAYRSLAEAIRKERAISPAAEWLVDNFHIVEEQLREIREDLPKSYYRELPKLTQGDFAGYPRIYAAALMLVAHTDSRLEVETLERFFRAYQKITPLNIGELWAVAITLRLALVENLRRLASRIVVSREERETADGDIFILIGKAVGSATLSEDRIGLRVELRVVGLPEGLHGVHVHTVGKCEGPEFTTAGAHFNPAGKVHGTLSTNGPHAGDLGNLEVKKDGTGLLSVTTPHLSLVPGASTNVAASGGLAIVVHAQADDEKTDPTGNSGARIACGVIKALPPPG